MLSVKLIDDDENNRKVASNTEHQLSLHGVYGSRHLKKKTEARRVRAWLAKFKILLSWMIVVQNTIRDLMKFSSS